MRLLDVHIIKKMIIVPFLVGLKACADIKYSPWQTNVPGGKRNATARNLSAIMDQEPQGLVPSPFKIVIIGDPQGAPGHLRSIIKRVNRISDVAFVLVLGDLTDYGLLHEYEEAYDALEKLNVPYLTAVGNHDALSHGKSIYKKMFGDFDYVFPYQGYRFVIWNNNKYEFGDSNFSWLEQQLAGDNVVVASHIPPFVGTHNQAEIDFWLSLYDRNDLATSMHGHIGTSDHYSFELNSGAPVYVVARALGLRYALVHFDPGNGVRYESCKDICESAK